MIWRAVVSRLEPLEVTIQGMHDRATKVECAFTVAVGDRVWVAQVAGSTDWVILAKR